MEKKKPKTSIIKETKRSVENKENVVRPVILKHCVSAGEMASETEAASGPVMPFLDTLEPWQCFYFSALVDMCGFFSVGILHGYDLFIAYSILIFKLRYLDF